MSTCLNGWKNSAVQLRVEKCWAHPRFRWRVSYKIGTFETISSNSFHFTNSNNSKYWDENAVAGFGDLLLTNKINVFCICGDNVLTLFGEISIWFYNLFGSNCFFFSNPQVCSHSCCLYKWQQPRVTITSFARTCAGVVFGEEWGSWQFFMNYIFTKIN